MIQNLLFSPFAYETCEMEKPDFKRFKSGVVLGLRYCSKARLSGKYGVPMIKAYRGAVPDKFITYSDSTRVTDYSCGVVSFDSDNVLERVWNNPEKYIPILSRFSCVGEPDFSLKLEYPLSIQIANTFRNHALAYHMQESGINVIPSMSWSSTVSYEFCFDGHEKGGAVVVSTIGTLGDERSNMFFRLGFEEMLKRIAPDVVVLYGDVNESLRMWLPQQLHVCVVDHNRFKRARKHGSKGSF
ncbi:MAG: DUF4417 domain-containing protein [Bacteroidales bacterium]|nr:DUF4417 domain-containing protein [Bacteroidales bacterium]